MLNSTTKLYKKFLSFCGANGHKQAKIRNNSDRI